MDANELKNLADGVNESKRAETERANLEKVNQVLRRCEDVARQGGYKLTYMDSCLNPQVLGKLTASKANNGLGLVVVDKSDRSRSRPHFSYEISWEGAEGK